MEKKLYLSVLLILVCILSISTISATENTTNKDVISVDNNQKINLETNIQYDGVSTSKENVELNLKENNNDKEDKSGEDETTTDNEDPLNFIDLNNTINGNKNRGRSVGIRNNINLNNNYNHNNNYNNYNYNNNNNNLFSGGMFNDNDPFNDPFFKFEGESRKNDNSAGDSLMDDQFQYDY